MDMIAIGSRIKEARERAHLTQEELAEKVFEKFLQLMDEETDEEALRVMRLMPRWMPGRQRDKITRVWVHYPVKFSPTEQ